MIRGLIYHELPLTDEILTTTDSRGAGNTCGDRTIYASSTCTLKGSGCRSFSRHFENHLAAIRDLCIGQIIPVQLPSINGNACDIDVLFALVLCFDSQDHAVFESQLRQFHDRASKSVTVRTRSHRIKSQCSEQIPGRHLAAIVVTAEAVWCWTILVFEDLPHTLLRFPWFRREKDAIWLDGFGEDEAVWKVLSGYL